MSLRRRRARPDARTVGLAALAGAGAFLAVYVIVTVATIGQLDDSLIGEVLDRGGVGYWAGTGWVVYEVHFVGLVPGGTLWGVDVSEVRRSGAAFSALPVYGIDEARLTFLKLVPPLALAVAGAAVTRLRGLTSVRAGAVTGAATVIGYLPPMIAGVFVFGIWDSAMVHSILWDWFVGTVTPALLWPIALTGLVYPLVFGGIGGALGVPRDVSAADSQPTYD